MLDPVSFLRRLAALIPPPYLHLVRYHGVFAPHARARRLLPPPPPRPDPAEGSEGIQAPSPDPPPLPATEPEHTLAPVATDPPARRRRRPWAELMKRVFAHDVLKCPACAGPMLLIAMITQPEIVRRILLHLKLPSSPPPLAPSRRSLQEEMCLDELPDDSAWLDEQAVEAPAAPSARAPPSSRSTGR